MSLTKEMMYQVESEIERFDNLELTNYNNTYRELQRVYPNSYYQYRLDKSNEEMIRRNLKILSNVSKK